MRLGILLCTLALPLSLSPALMGVATQDMNILKAGVVRISNGKFGQVGTGFIVKVENDRIYIVTSSHVVRGNEHPDVYLYSRQRDPLKATVLDREEDSLKGLALLTIKSEGGIFYSLKAFSLRDSSQLDGGEDVKIIGFPNSTAIWTVSSATIARLEGRNLAFSGTIRKGYSGGPVILNGQVVGLVTDVGEDFAYATRSENIVSYVNGFVKDLTAKPSPSPQPVVQDEFCQTLATLIDASKDGFYSIVGASSNAENTFHPKIMVPGAKQGFVVPKREVY